MLKLISLKEITTQLTVENQEPRARNQDDVFVQIRIVVFERIINNKPGLLSPFGLEGDKQGAWGLCQKGGLIPESNWVESRGF